MRDADRKKAAQCMRGRVDGLEICLEQVKWWQENEFDPVECLRALDTPDHPLRETQWSDVMEAALYAHRRIFNQ